MWSGQRGEGVLARGEERPVELAHRPRQIEQAPQRQRPVPLPGQIEPCRDNAGKPHGVCLLIAHDRAEAAELVSSCFANDRAYGALKGLPA